MKKFKAFIALDATNNKKNIEVVKKLYKLVYGFKVGYRSFYNIDADKLIAQLIKIKRPEMNKAINFFLFLISIIKIFHFDKKVVVIINITAVHKHL